MKAMLRRRPELQQQYAMHYPEPEKGKALLWLLPWDGGAQSGLSLSALDLWFLEVCRRVRLVTTATGAWEALEATADKPRIANAKDLKGNTGDFWAPLEITTEGPKAFSATSQGFTRGKLCEILFGIKTKSGSSWKLPPSLRAAGETNQVLLMRAAVLARSEGKTKGYHEIVVPFGPHFTRRLQGAEVQRKYLATQAQKQLEDISQIDKALARACALWAKGGKTSNNRESDGKNKNDDKKDTNKGHQKKNYTPYRKELDHHVDELFFNMLNDYMEKLDVENKKDAETLYHEWLVKMVDYGDKLLEKAMKTIPCPYLQRPKGRVAAINAYRKYLIYSEDGQFSASKELRQHWGWNKATPSEQPAPATLDQQS
ncbi:hypothetical protein E3E12_03280 [Formicincola oecophyllae]|uniref:Uncharacterized protein n=1 Tax=Formicincola oecophyllae TaxID=2558361 RepID=A0A4Y6UB91_9PROT|nr:hypothetical protein [Formicincola oecophyllae]QDH13385.2 hypothetical protein E3E12_03280 [Formicincola oecophyllae]